jgi:NAD(P)-dependent dehydrogenase (short-subunit alcohol dehydrogenase family)
MPNSEPSKPKPETTAKPKPIETKLKQGGNAKSKDDGGALSKSRNRNRNRSKKGGGATQSEGGQPKKSTTVSPRTKQLIQDAVSGSGKPAKGRNNNRNLKRILSLLLKNIVPPFKCQKQMWKFAGVVAALCIVLHYVSRDEFAVHETGAIVVTGASSGIGKHAALELAGRGYIVFAGVRKDADADALRSDAAKGPYPANMRPIILDVTNRTSIDLAAAEVTREIQALKLNLIGLVNNAGVTRELPLELQTDENIRFVYEVNVFGVMAVTRTFIPMLRNAGPGSRIVNIGSVAGLVATPIRATYCGSKHALEAITDTTRLELNKWCVFLITAAACCCRCCCYHHRCRCCYCCRCCCCHCCCLLPAAAVLDTYSLRSALNRGISVSIVNPAYVKTPIGEKSVAELSPAKALSTEQFELYAHLLEGADEKRKKVRVLHTIRATYVLYELHTFDTSFLCTVFCLPCMLPSTSASTHLLTFDTTLWL